MGHKCLSIYLGMIVIFQMVILIGTASDPYSGGFYFNPRFGIDLLLTENGLGKLPDLVQWLTVAALLFLAIALFRNEKAVWWYVFAEGLMALPTIVVFALVLRVNISPAHGFSVGELTIPAIVFVVCTVIPWSWAIMLLYPPRQNVVPKRAR